MFLSRFWAREGQILAPCSVNNRQYIRVTDGNFKCSILQAKEKRENIDIEDNKQLNSSDVKNLYKKYQFLRPLN